MSALPLLFMGSPETAVVILEGLMKAGHKIRAVITQPDKPAGRGQRLHPPPVKVFAESRHLPVLQPIKLRDPEFLKTLKAYPAQAIVVAAYGKLIPPEILNFALWGCLNVHFSLLPKYRGASCVAAAIRNGETESGVTLMKINETLDAGPLLKQIRVSIDPDETTGELEGRLAGIGSKCMVEILEEMQKGSLQPQEQDESAATYAPLLKKEEGRIDWGQTARQIHNHIRAMNPWPVAWTNIDKKRLKVYRSKAPLTPALSLEGEEPVLSMSKDARRAGEGEFGEITNVSEDGIEVSCGEGKILLTEIQPESKRRMNAWDFFQGHKDLIQIGKRFE